MAELAPEMNWDFSMLRDTIINFNLNGPDTICELVAYLKEKHQKEEKTIQIGLGEMARPVNRKMLFFVNKEDHAFVRLRLSNRKGRIEDQDGVPFSIKLKDDCVNKMIVKVRSSTSKLSNIRACEGHGEKFRSRVSDNLLNETMIILHLEIL